MLNTFHDQNLYRDLFVDFVLEIVIIALLYVLFVGKENGKFLQILIRSFYNMIKHVTLSQHILGQGKKSYDNGTSYYKQEYRTRQ